MATLEMNKEFSLVELTRRNFGGVHLEIAQVLMKYFSALKDAPYAQANDTFRDRGVKWKNLPTPTKRKFGDGIDATAGQTEPLEEVIMMLEDMSAADIALIDNAPDPRKERISEAEMHIEGMAQQGAEDLIYGNKTEEPEGINGFATRYGTLSLSNVVSAGGSGSDLTSLWIVEWDIQKGACFIYPKGSKAGIDHEDLDEQLVAGKNGKKMRAYVDYFKWHFGLRIKDDRAVQRIANIESSGSSNILSPDDIVNARNRLPLSGEDGGAAIYVNRTLKAQLDVAAMNKTNGCYPAKDLWGGPVTIFQGMQVRLMEAILDTESAVV